MKPVTRFLGLLLAFVLAACAQMPAGERQPAIVFVHGNGDTAALWHTTMWRFESNGYDRRLLHAIDFPYPLARSVDATPQSNRSSTEDQKRELAAKIEEVRRLTGSDKVVLVGNSRGGNAIRNYVKNGGGAAYVSHAILSGATNHGVFDWEETRGSEFNAKSDFLMRLNSGPDEVVPGVRFMTIRSDANDKFAYPEGRFLGSPGRPTGIGPEAPELKGALNVVIPRIDHRETAYHPLAFEQMYRFVVGRRPASLDIAPEAAPVLNGKVNGYRGGAPTNLPVEGAKLEVFEVSAQSGERLGGPVHSKLTGADGLWGPFRAKPNAYYEFVLTVPGHPVTHLYRSPFPRSSDIIHLRPASFAKGEEAAGGVVMTSRPRGYFGHGRDRFLLDGKVPPGINEGVPGASVGKLLLPAGAGPRSIPARFNGESITVRAWPGAIVIAEFHY